MSKKSSGLNVKRASRSKLREGMTIMLSSEKRPDKVTFGSVTVTADRVVKAELSRNVDLGQFALKNIAESLAKPGVKVPKKSKTIPLFHADPANPRRVVRILDGKKETGVFENGQFKAAE